MDYLLAVLTNGRADCLARTLAAYAEYLSPTPAAMVVYDDGGTTPLNAIRSPWPGVEAQLESYPRQLGRCAAHARLWQAVARSELDWAFVVEDDILLLRPLDLHELAYLIDAEPELQQLALVRAPWGAEVWHGGYIPMNSWKYERRSTPHVGGYEEARFEWIASMLDWTSSPALLPTQLAREVDWPADPGCESELGPRVLALRPDAVSGYWGWGEAWVAHIGLERAPGSHGY